MRYPEKIERAILERRPFDTVQLAGYNTRGGTYILASPPEVNDDEQWHDLVAITPWDTVYPLRPTAVTNAVEGLLWRKRAPKEGASL